jgi:hypothetical protein
VRGTFIENCGLVYKLLPTGFLRFLPMNAVDYIEREFEPFVAVSRYQVLSAGTKRIAERVHRIFERISQARFPGQEITIAYGGIYVLPRCW